jgi:hypothetical protein
MALSAGIFTQQKSANYEKSTTSILEIGWKHVRHSQKTVKETEKSYMPGNQD